jgi:hypothetical protein
VANDAAQILVGVASAEHGLVRSERVAHQVEGLALALLRRGPAPAHRPDRERPAERARHFTCSEDTMVGKVAPPPKAAIG